MRERIDRILSAGGAQFLTTLDKREQLAAAAFQAQPRTAPSGAQAVPAQPLAAREGSDPLFGDPVAGCSSSRYFYSASLAEQVSSDLNGASREIRIRRSTDLGASFGATAPEFGADEWPGGGRWLGR